MSKIRISAKERKHDQCQVIKLIIMKYEYLTSIAKSKLLLNSTYVFFS